MTPQPFTRSRFTLSAYILLGFYAFIQSALGPIMPFVRAELALNYTVTGLHLTAFAFGMVIAGSSSAPIAHRIGRRRLYWGGGLGMCIGCGLFMLAQIAPLTILGTFVMGWLGTYLLVMIQSTLSDAHLENRAIAFTESNIVASIFAIFAPIMVGVGISLGLTWRFALTLGIGLWIVIVLFFRNAILPKSKFEKREVEQQESLPRLFWFYWFVVFLSVALEWCMIFWSADFLEKIVKLPTEQATSILSVYLLAMLIGRLIGSRLAYRYPSRQLFWLAIGVVVAGFPMFWLGQVPSINILGLFIVGLGTANLFPLGLSIASDVGENASDLASSWVSLGAGLAILILPQVLGSTADIIGIFNAYAVVPMFLVLLTITLLLANRQVQP
jgi:fucose permease